MFESGRESAKILLNSTVFGGRSDLTVSSCDRKTALSAIKYAVALARLVCKSVNLLLIYRLKGDEKKRLDNVTVFQSVIIKKNCLKNTLRPWQLTLEMTWGETADTQV